MGLLSLFSKPADAGPGLLRLYSGSFTVDRNGRINACTLPQSFPAAHLKAIADSVLGTFREAQAAQAPLTELTVEYAALKLTARELRGGAIVFLTPRSLTPK
jgi:hypothetical protein